jgi:hypothetical protein
MEAPTRHSQILFSFAPGPEVGALDERKAYRPEIPARPGLSRRVFTLTEAWNLKVNSQLLALGSQLGRLTVKLKAHSAKPSIWAATCRPRAKVKVMRGFYDRTRKQAGGQAMTVAYREWPMTGDGVEPWG